MSTLFFGLACACGLAVVGLAVGTLAVVASSPVDWKRAAIIAWALLAAAVLGALFAAAALAIESAQEQRR